MSSLKRISDGIAYANPGAFTRRAVIYKAFQTDQSGSQAADVTVAEVWASVQGVKESSERDKALTDVTIRYLDTVRVGFFVKLLSTHYIERHYQILSIEDPDARKKELHLICEEFIPTQCQS